ncbi:Mu transposase domain-containing protein [Pantoea endophytica]|uniref:Transposase for insertion sequence element IS21-like C-terminal domain-containing protein n=1 Tax=Pantoea sp. BJ2 TaxID=3141322 RepID=A0AAU7U3S2_9GAMM
MGGLLKELNHRAYRHYPGSSRQTRFDALDRPALTALPRCRYEYTDIRRAKVGPDYHVLYQRHAYSVPHALVGSHIDIEAGTRLVRLYHRGQMVAQHSKALKEGGFTTLNEHMPELHRH